MFSLFKLQQNRLFWKLRYYLNQSKFLLNKIFFKVGEKRKHLKETLSIAKELIRIVAFSFLQALFLVFALEGTEKILIYLLGQSNLIFLKNLLNCINKLRANLFTFTESFETLLSIVASISGVLMGLYFTAVSVVTSSMFAKVPEDLRGLFLKERVGNVYIKILSLIIAVSIILLGFKAFGEQPGILNSLFIILLGCFIDVLISTDAAYVGLNLQIADTIIHYDLSWNPMVVEQRIGRIHRIGQKKPVTSYSFLCKDTIDKRKHEILTKKLEEISTHLGISYSVVLSEVAVSSEIEKIMAQLELKEIDDRTLEEKLKKHIADRKEIFDLLEELPSEEAEILQVGFTNSLIDKIEDITGEIVKMSKELLDFKIHPIIENNNFFILSYKKDGRIVKELSTLNEEALINVNFENIKEWKKKYGFENLNPSYIGPFHYLIEKASNLWIEKNKGKFFRKLNSDKNVVSFYILLPLKIKNLTADIDMSLDIFVPVLYEPEKKEIKIDIKKIYELSMSSGKTEDVDENDKALIEEAKKILYNEIENIKSKIRADIEKVNIEIEELALQKQRVELEKKIAEKRQKLEGLSKEITRKRNSGQKYDKEMHEAKRIKEELDNLQRQLEVTPKSGLIIEFGEPNLIGGCIYYS